MPTGNGDIPSGEAIQRLAQMFAGAHISIEKNGTNAIWFLANKCGYLKVQREFMRILQQIHWIKATNFQSRFVAGGELIGALCVTPNEVDEDTIRWFEIHFSLEGRPLSIVGKSKNK